MATETYWCPGPWPWEWFRTCTREVPDDPCNARACTDAKARLDDARRRINSICFGLRTLNALAKLLRMIVSTPIWIVIAMALIAAIVGGPIAVIIWSFIALYGISWLLLIVVTRMAQSLVVSLEDARIAFRSAVTDVVTQCPEQCRGDVSIPECQIE